MRRIILVLAVVAVMAASMSITMSAASAHILDKTVPILKRGELASGDNPPAGKVGGLDTRNGGVTNNPFYASPCPPGDLTC